MHDPSARIADVNEDDCCDEAIAEAADSCVEMVRAVCGALAFCLSSVLTASRSC